MFYLDCKCEACVSAISCVSYKCLLCLFCSGLLKIVFYLHIKKKILAFLQVARTQCLYMEGKTASCTSVSNKLADLLRLDCSKPSRENKQQNQNKLTQSCNLSHPVCFRTHVLNADRNRCQHAFIFSHEERSAQTWVDP